MIPTDDRGSAHSGMTVWWWQRISGVYIALFAIPLIIMLKGLDETDYDTIVAYLSSPLGKALSFGFVLSLLAHAYIGLRIIIEDYVPSAIFRLPFVALLNFFVVIIGMWAALLVLQFAS
jgi:succinate dehydrogenase / fumarate reductase membrane anchor subunit